MRPDDHPLEASDVVQLSPDTDNPAFAGTMLVVTEVRGWGVVGYVQALGTAEGPGGLAYLRATWEQIEYVGRARWVSV